jgi:hypothetical protein
MLLKNCSVGTTHKSFVSTGFIEQIMPVIAGFSLYNLGSENSTENIHCLAVDICEPHKNTSSDTGSIHLFKVPLYSNGSYPIVACVFVAAGICLPRRSLAMGLHVKICSLKVCNFQKDNGKST